MPSNSTFFYRQAPPQRGASSFIYPPTPGNIAFFAEALNAGCLVAIPTETVYGLAGLALNQESCRSIFSIKGRPLVDPLILHVSGIEMAERVAEITPEARLLAAKLWPGPLTLILRKLPSVPDIVTAGKPTVAIRMPAHPVSVELLNALNQPLAAPSANPFGYVSPTRPEHVRDSFSSKVPFIIDGGPCRIGIESTILDLARPGHPGILRPGAISSGMVEKVLGIPVEKVSVSLDPSDAADAPGTFSKHYSPEAQVVLFSVGTLTNQRDDAAKLYLQRPERGSDSPDVYWLSESGDPLDISRTLFHLLRHLDTSGYKTIHCEVPLPGADGIQIAIRDRLMRAASR